MTTDYPSEEIKQIVARRKQLNQELIAFLMLTGEREQNQRLKELVTRYGQAEVDHALDFYRRGLTMRSPDDENAVFYRAYVDYYRRFGGQRRLLTLAEYIEANEEYAPLIIRHELGKPLTTAEQERLAYLTDLMLKEATFWDDIMPENPPSQMPEVKLPPLKQAVPRPAAGHSADSYPVCPNDGFPMIDINGRLECCMEALNRCLGQKKVVEVVQRRQTIYYVFEDGHELPLLCGCCGQGLAVKDLDQERKRVCGRRLESISIGASVIEADKSEFDELILGFSKLGFFAKPLAIAVAFEVAAQLRHPGAGPGRRAGAPSKQQARSPKKDRSGKKRDRKKKR
jgi:hypothetical protein